MQLIATKGIEKGREVSAFCKSAKYFQSNSGLVASEFLRNDFTRNFPLILQPRQIKNKKSL